MLYIEHRCVLFDGEKERTNLAEDDKRDIQFVSRNMYVDRTRGQEMRSVLTVSGSRGCSTNAENSTSLSLCVAMARPSHGGGGATSVPPGTPTTPTPGTPLYPAPGKGLTL